MKVPSAMWVAMLAVSCGEPQQYGYDLPPDDADGFTPLGAMSSDVDEDSSARRMRRLVLGEILGEPSLLEPSPGLTVRTWFLDQRDSAPSWVAVRVAQVGDSAVVARSGFAIQVYTGSEERDPPSLVERSLTRQQMSQFRSLLEAARLWSLSPYIPTADTVQVECADCAPEPWCEIELRENSRYHLVRREHHLVRGDTVGLRETDRHFYKLCSFLRSLRGGA
jgi:hypothetical protein